MLPARVLRSKHMRQLTLVILFDGDLRTDGKAWLAQIVMFLMRRLLGVAQPTEASLWAYPAGGGRAV